MSHFWNGVVFVTCLVFAVLAANSLPGLSGNSDQDSLDESRIEQILDERLAPLKEDMLEFGKQHDELEKKLFELETRVEKVTARFIEEGAGTRTDFKKKLMPLRTEILALSFRLNALREGCEKQGIIPQPVGYCDSQEKAWNGWDAEDVPKWDLPPWVPDAVLAYRGCMGNGRMTAKTLEHFRSRVGQGVDGAFGNY